MKASLFVLSLLVVLSSGAVARADNFDGTWQGTAPASSRTCAGVDFQMTVTNGAITGSMNTYQGVRQLSGSVSPDGTFFAGPAGGKMIEGKMIGGKLTGLVHLFCGQTTAIGQKSS